MQTSAFVIPKMGYFDNNVCDVSRHQKTFQEIWKYYQIRLPWRGNVPQNAEVVDLQSIVVLKESRNHQNNLQFFKSLSKDTFQNFPPKWRSLNQPLYANKYFW